MKTIPFLLMVMCVSASAAPLPPLVTRPKALHSPKHAATKDKAMFVPASEIPVLPMEAYVRAVESPYGKWELTAGALQPAGFGLVFEVSPVLADWQPLATFGPVPYAQKSYTALYSFSETLNVRAKLVPQPVNVRSAKRTAAGYIGVNSSLSGVRAWSVRK